MNEQAQLEQALKTAGIKSFVEKIIDKKVYIGVFENEIKRPLRAKPYGNITVEYLCPPFDRNRFTNDDGKIVVKLVSFIIYISYL